MLKTRVITALVLLALFLPAVFFLPPFGWALFAAVIAGLGAWEFGRLASFSQPANIVCGVVVAALCVGLTQSNPDLLAGGAMSPLTRAILAASALFWLLVAPFWLRYKWRLQASMWALPVGLLLIVPTWIALVVLWRLGPLVLFLVMALVWIADIAAYFTGRAFGRHKLAPAISPGKTWEGAWGAIAGVMLYGMGVLLLGGIANVSVAAAVVVLPLLTFISIEGDLFESLLKRQAGLKDSSGLLPGHGGVLDRIDSLTSTLPLAALLLTY
jgi:phosphatidate cytidylyltransferase